MSDTIRKALSLPHPPERVWRALSTREGLEAWMYPNDFEPRVGHRFVFHVPPKPEIGFEGLIVDCEVLVCEPPARLVFSWSAGGPVVNTRVSFQLEAEGDGSRLVFEHSGFDLSHPFAPEAIGGATYGWQFLLERLADVLAQSSTPPSP